MNFENITNSAYYEQCEAEALFCQQQIKENERGWLEYDEFLKFEQEISHSSNYQTETHKGFWMINF